ncbi:hypothetical protein RF11_08988 [Thelohanellus kitauei]|uniref:Uncharacterized protein n=1 Tax=Thelohanellus kitauei TaxID=669202 RepID=A0A0C2MME9_THEKT|nr:hypothetical protein RF11_08988 [Thelohanellus kitauei]
MFDENSRVMLFVSDSKWKGHDLPNATPYKSGYRIDIKAVIHVLAGRFIRNDIPLVRLIIRDSIYQTKENSFTRETNSFESICYVKKSSNHTLFIASSDISLNKFKTRKIQLCFPTYASPVY